MPSRLHPETRKLLARLPLAAAVAFALWFAGVSELWGRSLTAVTEPCVRLFERPRATFLMYEGGAAVITRSDFGSQSETPAQSLAGLTANVVLLLALAFATPGAGQGRAPLRLLLGLALLFVSHVVHLALAVETLYATQLGEWSVAAYPRWEREVLASSRYFFDIVLTYALPLVVWGALVLAPLRRGAAPERPEARRKRKR